MAEKHYDIGYLHDTGQILRQLKERSYEPFYSIKSGVLIDLGCGAGNDAINMAEKLGNGVNIVGMDHDPVMLDHARNAASLSNVRFLLAEAYPIPFDNGTISGLRTERLIQHLTNADQVFNDIYRVLKKDHPFVIVETDWRSLSFYSEYVETEKKVNDYLTEKKVNNGFAARRLTGYLEKTGFRNIRLEVHPFVITSLKAANEYFWIERIIKETVEKNFITEDDYRTFYNSLEKADTMGYFSCSVNLVLVSCLK